MHAFGEVSDQEHERSTFSSALSDCASVPYLYRCSFARALFRYLVVWIPLSTHSDSCSKCGLQTKRLAQRRNKQAKEEKNTCAVGYPFPHTVSPERTSVIAINRRENNRSLGDWIDKMKVISSRKAERANIMQSFITGALETSSCSSFLWRFEKRRGTGATTMRRDSTVTSAKDSVND